MGHEDSVDLKSGVPMLLALQDALPCFFIGIFGGASELLPAVLAGSVAEGVYASQCRCKKYLHSYLVRSSTQCNQALVQLNTFTTS